jgi:hypothetical protein
MSAVPFKYRVLITIVVVLAILFALALYGYLTGAWDMDAQAQAQTPKMQPDVLSKYERRIVELDRAGIDAAYQAQITHLFQTWMKDEQGQPARALNGAKQARSAYERSIDAIVAREQRLEVVK